MRILTGGTAWDLPLVHTEVDASISGFVADVEVTQLYSNPLDEPIEAVYLFPLPDRAAVNAMEMQVGDRRIVGSIERRADAQAIYEAARNAGQTAALLDQERPNIFQQSVANILPGDSIEITIRFIQQLDYQDGGYEWTFPMVVGPRYIPVQGTGHSGPSKPTEDADRIQAPVSPVRTGNDIHVMVQLDAGLPLRDLRSPSHELRIDRLGTERADVELAAHDSIPNKDFILRYDVAGDAPQTALLTHADDEGGTFLLMIQPPSEDGLDPRDITPKEMVFVVDTSCSMSGEPLSRAKEAMSLAISEMNPNDRFTVLDFNSSVSSLSRFPLPNSAANRARGLQYVQNFRGEGGTDMIEGIRSSLDLPTDPELLRTVLFMTDGYIGNEREILAAIEERLGRSRLYSFGIGSSVNRYLLDRMAKVGRGHVQYVRQDEDSTDSIEAFYNRIRNPILTDIEVEWEGLEVLDVYPDPIPDLFSGQPLFLVGRYTEGGEGTVRLTGRVRGREFVQELPVVFPDQEPAHAALPALWARRVIEDLEGRQSRRPNPGIAEEITGLALRHSLMSQYTSFVAVEERVVTQGGEAPKRVRVPLETPEGVNHDAVFGGTNPSSSMQLHMMAPPHPTSAGASPRVSYRIQKSRSSVSRGAQRQRYGRTTGSMPLAEADRADVSLDEPKQKQPVGRMELKAVGDWSSVDTTNVRTDLLRRLRSIEASWKTEAASSKASGGTWTVRLHLSRDGKVQRVEVLADSLGRKGLLQEVLRLAPSWWLTEPLTGKATTLTVEIAFLRS